MAKPLNLRRAWSGVDAPPPAPLQTTPSGQQRPPSTQPDLELRTHAAEAAPEADPLEAMLRRAILCEELAVFYQPVVDATSKCLVGAEALVRWESPDLGCLGAESVIPLAEQFDLIHPLTLWVINEALSRCHDWHLAGTRLGVSVNLAPVCLADSQFARRIAIMLRGWNLSPDRLTLELTESETPADQEGAHRTLDQLRAMGVRIALDHFGRGHSGLGRMQRLQADHVKIDRSYISGFLSKPVDRAIVEGLVAMAHRMGYLVYATGVEDPAALDALAEAGCDFLQGAALGEALPHEQFAQRWIAPQNE